VYRTAFGRGVAQDAGIQPICMFLRSDSNVVINCMGCVGQKGEKFCTKHRSGSSEQDTCGIQSHAQKTIFVMDHLYFWNKFLVVFQACDTSNQVGTKILWAKGVGHFWDQFLTHASGQGESFQLKLADSSDNNEDEEDKEYEVKNEGGARCLVLAINLYHQILCEDKISSSPPIPWNLSNISQVPRYWW
jgi:hypothetical protein